MTKSPELHCSDEQISSLLIAIQHNDKRALSQTDDLIRNYSGDARLHFLRGSLLAAGQNYEGAEHAMRQALDLAPNYQLARFQLGLLLLTRGRPLDAQEIWSPLRNLPLDSYLSMFVRGLCHLIRDEFDDARSLLVAGIAQNCENAPINKDMQLIVDSMRGF